MAWLNHISSLTFILLVVLCLRYSCARKLLLDDLIRPTSTPPYRPSPPAPIPCDPSCNPFDRSCQPSSGYACPPCDDPCSPWEVSGQCLCPPIIENKTASYSSMPPGKERSDGAPMSTSPLGLNNETSYSTVPPGQEKQEVAPMSTSSLSPNHENQEGAPMGTTPVILNMKNQDSEPKLQGKSVGSESPEKKESTQEAHGVVSRYRSTKATEKMDYGGSAASYTKDDSTQLHA